MLWEALLTCGLVSVILGTASGAQQLGPIAAIGVGSYIALAGLFGAPVSGASMNPARSLGPALVLADWTSWWAYLAGPLIGAGARGRHRPHPARPRRRHDRHPRRPGHPGHGLDPRPHRPRPTPPPATTARPAGPRPPRPVRPGPRPVGPRDPASGRRAPSLSRPPRNLGHAHGLTALGPERHDWPFMSLLRRDWPVTLLGTATEPAMPVSGAGAGGAADAGGGGGAGGQAVGGDGPATGGAGAVAALVQAAQRRVDLVEVLARPLQQRGGVLALERDRRALGVVLVVVLADVGRLDDAAARAPARTAGPGSRSGPRPAAPGAAGSGISPCRDISAAGPGGPVDSADVGAIRQAGTMAESLTLMAVHAHPDDEASSTGGVLAKYSAEGIRTVVVTCTNGEFGDAPGQVKPGKDGHDEQAVAQIRLSELRESAKILGVTTWNCSATTTRACRSGTTGTGPTRSATCRRTGGGPDRGADRAVPAAGGRHL